MIWYIVTDTMEHYRKKTKWHGIKLTLESLAEDLCLCLHFSQITAARLRELRPWAICYSGSSTPFSKYDLLQTRPLLACLRRWPGAQIGFCAGHQLMAVALGGTVNRMRKLRKGEIDSAPTYFPGWFKEWGPSRVKILKPHPLFHGLPPEIKIIQYHSDEVASLPRSLDLLASSGDCRIQAFAHRNRPFFGTQFHPEEAGLKHPHGLVILGNFFRLARRVQKKQLCSQKNP